MGGIVKEEQFEWEIKYSEAKEYKDVNYKLFKHGDYKVRSSNGGFRCPLCKSKDEGDDYNYARLLQHAVQTAEAYSMRGNQRAKHSAMATYLAVDLACEVNAAEEVKLSSDSDDEPLMKRLRSATPTSNSKSNCGDSNAARTPPSVNARKVAIAEKREKEALNKVGELERKMNEMRDEMNALITKEQSIKDELQRTSRELIKEKDLNNKLNNSRDIGIKKIGEIDMKVFRQACLKRFSAEEAEIKGFELCSLWQTKLTSYYQFCTFVNNKYVVNERDASLRKLKVELGDEAHNAVVTSIKELIEYESGGPKNYWLWNFEENRKARLEEVISWLKSGRREQVELKYVLVSIK